MDLAKALEKIARWLLRLSEFHLDVVLQASIKHRAADALWRLTIDGKDNTDLNDALLVLTTVPANEAKEAEEIDEKHHFVIEAHNAIAPGLTAVFHIARTLLIEVVTAEFLAEHSEDLLCGQLASTAGTTGFDHFQSQWIRTLRCPYRRSDTESRFTIPTGAPSTYVSLPTSSSTSCRMKDVRHHATRRILATRGQRCIQNLKRFPRIGTQSRE